MEALKKEASNELTTPPNKDSLSGFRGKVKLKAYLDEKGITTKVAANTVKTGGYPKCSSAAISFASNTSMTGVQLVTDVYGILYDAHGEPSDLLIRRRSDNRSKPCDCPCGLRKASTERLTRREESSRRKSSYIR